MGFKEPPKRVNLKFMEDTELNKLVIEGYSGRKRQKIETDLLVEKAIDMDGSQRNHAFSEPLLETNYVRLSTITHHNDSEPESELSSTSSIDEADNSNSSSEEVSKSINSKNNKLDNSKNNPKG